MNILPKGQAEIDLYFPTVLTTHTQELAIVESGTAIWFMYYIFHFMLFE